MVGVETLKGLRSTLIGSQKRGFCNPSESAEHPAGDSGDLGDAGARVQRATDEAMESVEGSPSGADTKVHEEPRRDTKKKPPISQIGAD